MKKENEADVCHEFSLLNSTVQTILKDRTSNSAFEQNGWRIKIFRKLERSDVNGALKKWFKQEK
jgi:hypothetical protein